MRILPCLFLFLGPMASTALSGTELVARGEPGDTVPIFSYGGSAALAERRAFLDRLRDRPGDLRPDAASREFHPGEAGRPEITAVLGEAPGGGILLLGSALGRSDRAGAVPLSPVTRLGSRESHATFADVTSISGPGAGVSGFLTAPRPSDGPVFQLGVNAALGRSESAFLTGSFVQSGSDRTFLGLSLGLRF